MSGQHTQGELCTAANYPHGKTSICTHTGTGWVEIGTAKTEADASRLVACWNACEGVSTAGVEVIARLGGIENKMRVTSELVRQRDELLAALNLLKAADFGANVKTAEDEKHMDRVAAFARAAIAKAEGGAV